MADVLWKYGEERFSRRIAKNIVRRREVKAIETTLDLVDAIGRVFRRFIATAGR